MSSAGYPAIQCGCGHKGEPTLACTELNGVLEIGAWCRACREFMTRVDPDPLACELAPPWIALHFTRTLPDPDGEWLTTRDPRTDFPFGANVGWRE